MTNDDLAQRIAAEAAKFIQHQATPVIGARLGIHLSRNFKEEYVPPKRLGFRNMAALIRKHAPEISVAKGGNDYLYAASATALTGDETSDRGGGPNLWRALTSPGSPYSLFVNR